MRVSGVPDCYVTSMRKASRRLTQLYDEAMAPSGLRSTQFSILAELSEPTQGPPTMGELAEVLVLDRSGLGHSLRPLEREGLIEFEVNPDDRRSRIVVLTKAGRDRYRQAHELWRSAQERYRSATGAAEADELRDRLQAIAHDDRLA
ncbi:MarR family winged helix-turn-helix transcriptional regulator [Umezawaea endophytica]|uniref:MarR family winged helix-turn-helix transcriptional regulator n=1 Tax=Umezawaea endophytica TaxID=1654476 RepID=A0A9X2VFE8_9PSEU|nr:MarR family winged helix-turn-helix transcriptional regulator [Umezawaea endophytica]MCS7475675.1 MarR family winged helix-turn-helix transcriptional regulator [Umezawaea endophytica]